MTFVARCGGTVRAMMHVVFIVFAALTVACAHGRAYVYEIVHRSFASSLTTSSVRVPLTDRWLQDHHSDSVAGAFITRMSAPPRCSRITQVRPK
ncbi:MAG: hypothetical protein ACRDAM_05420, partial [Casimicrobium sp.]